MPTSLIHRSSMNLSEADSSTAFIRLIGNKPGLEERDFIIPADGIPASRESGLGLVSRASPVQTAVRERPVWRKANDLNGSNCDHRQTDHAQATSADSRIFVAVAIYCGKDL